MRLLEHRNLLMEIMKAEPKPRGELQCNREEKPEFVMRNVKLDRKVIKITEDWVLPQEGLLEFDYTDISKPSSISGPVRGSIIPELQLLGTEEQRLARWKEYLGGCFVSLRQVKQGLALELFKTPENRVEFVRLAFARTIEWHGFHQVTSMLTKEDMTLLIFKLGRHNLFDETAAVGYYQLDLAHDEDRWSVWGFWIWGLGWAWRSLFSTLRCPDFKVVVQSVLGSGHFVLCACGICSFVTANRVAAQIVRLAVLEPGDNMIGECIQLLCKIVFNRSLC
jgi:hypothetical protein